MFEGILFVHGSPVSIIDLRRAGIYRAQQVIVLASPPESASTVSIGSISHSHHAPPVHANQSEGANMTKEALEDVDAIFAFQCVKKMNNSANVVIEMVHANNIAYLDFETNVSNSSSSDYKFTQHFASGTIFTSSLLDTLLCQSFYNPNIIRVVNKLIGGMDHKSLLEMISSEKNSKNLKRTKDNDESESKASNTETNLEDIVPSCLYQIDVPENLERRTFGYMFKKLSRESNILPVAVLRGTLPQMSAGPNGNKTPYVVTNPHRGMALYSCDKLFVLSQKPVQSGVTKKIAESFNEIKTFEDKQKKGQLLKFKEDLKNEFSEIHSGSEKINDLLASVERKNDIMFTELSQKIKATSMAVANAAAVRKSRHGSLSSTASRLQPVVTTTPPRALFDRKSVNKPKPFPFAKAASYNESLSSSMMKFQNARPRAASADE